MIKKECAVCGKAFESSRADSKYCSTKCRKEASRRVSAESVDSVDVPRTSIPMKFTVPTSSEVREAVYWYDVPVSAIPTPEEGWPELHPDLNGRQYFLWKENNFKLNDNGNPVIRNPYPQLKDPKYEPAGEQSRRWGA